MSLHRSTLDFLFTRWSLPSIKDLFGFLTFLSLASFVPFYLPFSCRQHEGLAQKPQREFDSILEDLFRSLGLFGLNFQE